jgi:hypothetical protein
MSLLVLTGVSVDETVDTSSTEGSSCDTLTLRTSPWTGLLAAAEGFDSTGDYGSFGGLLPLFRLLALASSTAAAARPGVVAALAVAIVVVSTVSVAIISTVGVSGCVRGCQ